MCLSDWEAGVVGRERVRCTGVFLLESIKPFKSSGPSVDIIGWEFRVPGGERQS